MKEYSNTYMFLYVTVLVVLVTVLLSLAVIVLGPRIDINKENEKMQQILFAAGYNDISPEQVHDIYLENAEEWMIDKDGIITDKYFNDAFVIGKHRAFNADAKLLYYNASEGKEYFLPVFLVKNDVDSTFVIPALGRGLWGQISCYIAIENDGKTVKGVVFSHKSETPGLGAEITSANFQNSFSQKQIFDSNGEFVSVQVVKGGVAQSNIDPKHGVDAIAGATITTSGVDDMLQDCLIYYVPFLKQYLR